MSKSIDFRPDYDQEPAGAYLSWFLEERGIKKVDFAKRCGRTAKTISEIIAGKAPITPETAIQFERVLGDSAGYWLRLDANYLLQQAREKEHLRINSAEAKNWAKQFPIAQMVKLGFLSHSPKPDELADTILRFFGVSSISAFDEFWQTRVSPTRFKQQDSQNTDEFAVAVWLRQGEIISSDVETEPYDEHIFRLALGQIRALTRSPWASIQKTLIELCANAGVGLALVPSLPKTGLRGAAYWAKKDKAVIVLSDRNKHEEHFWFAFFHEAAHILLHSKKSIFIDRDETGTESGSIEQEADDFAAELLVPAKEIQRFRRTYGSNGNSLGAEVLEDFSATCGVSPGLLLARLQHERIIDWSSNLNRVLKRGADFAISN